MRHQIFLRRTLAIAALVVLSTFASPRAFADSACVGGSLSIVIGTTCDIGSLQFTFNGWSSVNYTYDATTGSYLHYTAPQATDIAFTVGANGFTLSGSPVSLTDTHSDRNSFTEEFGYLSYTVNDPFGEIVAVNVSDNGISASGTGGSATSEVSDTLCDISFCTALTGYDYSQYSNSTTVHLGPGTFNSSSGFSSGAGTDLAFDLYGADGGSASWNGSSTFTYSAINTPEPTFMSTLGIGLLALLAGKHPWFRRFAL